MHISRKFVYVMILAYYYTFIIIYSWGLGYTDVIMSVVMITVVSYAWLVRSISRAGAFTSFDYKDLTVTIFVYSFISFFVAGMALAFSGKPVDFMHAFLIITPITVWIFIWTDYYIQKLKGKM